MHMHRSAAIPENAKQSTHEPGADRAQRVPGLSTANLLGCNCYRYKGIKDFKVGYSRPGRIPASVTALTGLTSLGIYLGSGTRGPDLNWLYQLVSLRSLGLAFSNKGNVGQDMTKLTNLDTSRLFTCTGGMAGRSVVINLDVNWSRLQQLLEVRFMYASFKFGMDILGLTKLKLLQGVFACRMSCLDGPTMQCCAALIQSLRIHCPSVALFMHNYTQLSTILE